MAMRWPIGAVPLQVIDAWLEFTPAERAHLNAVVDPETGQFMGIGIVSPDRYLGKFADYVRSSAVLVLERQVSHDMRGTANAGTLLLK